MQKHDNLTASGICIGASTITWVHVTGQPNGTVQLDQSGALSHEGNPQQVLRNLFEQGTLPSTGRMAATGRRLRHHVALSSVPEPEAVEYAYRHHFNGNPDGPGTVVSAGGETFMVYRMDPAGRVSDVRTGNKCASGTGEFFLQQLKRMDLSVDAALKIATLDKPYRVAGRCSVFCKSDCTHALNKGADKGHVVAGLCEMMAVKIQELLKTGAEGHVLLVGGSSANTVMTSFLREAGIAVKVPESGRVFEALGAALWALERETKPIPAPDALFSHAAMPFSLLAPLTESLPRVRFMKKARARAEVGDSCVIGLDVGSTTTKAVVVRRSDKAILAGCYLRTNGDPIAASRACHAELARQMAEQPTTVNAGLGVTGSGRRIAGLHAMTPAIINEIIAHARAAAHFDPEVDTLFEIGGQDAKYTHLTQGVASDYAMNEACSAGTGSFLEESAQEALHYRTEEIGEAALLGKRPPNFNDQCTAFIGSDIKTAIQNGLGREDIAAGLVYSICMNYLNRVKGNRSVGRKILMQGGVCYNRAIPAAMAALTGKEIIVPPEPGLMGAYGVALEVDAQIGMGLLKEGVFDLFELAGREVAYEEPFVCKGGREACDRKCSIRRIRVGGRVFPFGGACSKYEHVLSGSPEPDAEALDLVALRERLLFVTYGTEWAEEGANTETRSFRQDQAGEPGMHAQNWHGTVGLNRSLMVNSLFPLYHAFFRHLGWRVVLPDAMDPEGCGTARRGVLPPGRTGAWHAGGPSEDESGRCFPSARESIAIRPVWRGECRLPVCPGGTLYLEDGLFRAIPNEGPVSCPRHDRWLRRRGT